MKTTKMGSEIALALTFVLAASLNAQNIYVASDGYLIGNISEYGPDGSTINASLIPTGLDYPTGIANSGNDLFVVNTDNNTVGEYTTSGATINPSLLYSWAGHYKALQFRGTMCSSRA